MNTRKLKAIFITACCFVVTLCSEIKSMDTASDLQETASYKAKNTKNESYLDSLKSEIDSNSSNTQLLLNGDENKAPETSWAMYTADTVKAVMKRTYNIADFSVKNPTRTIITSLLIGAQFTAIDAYCNCIRLTAQSVRPSSRPALAHRCLWGGTNETACMQLAQAFGCGNPTLCYYGCFN